MQKALKLATVGVPSLFFLETVVSAPEIYKQGRKIFNLSKLRVFQEPSKSHGCSGA
jgi:hypothetical protein